MRAVRNAFGKSAGTVLLGAARADGHGGSGGALPCRVPGLFRIQRADPGVCALRRRRGALRHVLPRHPLRPGSAAPLFGAFNHHGGGRAAHGPAYLHDRTGRTPGHRGMDGRGRHPRRSGDRPAPQPHTITQRREAKRGETQPNKLVRIWQPGLGPLWKPEGARINPSSLSIRALRAKPGRSEIGPLSLQAKEASCFDCFARPRKAPIFRTLAPERSEFLGDAWFSGTQNKSLPFLGLRFCPRNGRPPADATDETPPMKISPLRFGEKRRCLIRPSWP